MTELYPTKKNPRKKFFALLFLTIILSFCAYLYLYFTKFIYEESTDDAYVAGNIIKIMPHTSGKVLEVLADDTDRVVAGQMLVRLDPLDAQLILDKAMHDLAITVRDISAMQAQLAEANAQIEIAKINLEQALTNLNRREVLRRKNAVPEEELNDYRSQLKTNTAQLESATKRKEALEAKLLDSPMDMQPQVKQMAAKIREAWLNLERTKVLSPITGQVAQKSVHPGMVVTPSTTLMSVAALSNLWVDANFKEVQLKNMRIGQPAKIKVDLHGSSIEYKGKVAGFAAGTGSIFSLIPPQNATGNWIKIVQRVPVRIEFTNEIKNTLIIGLSSMVTVDISDNSGALLLDNIRDRELPEAFKAKGTVIDLLEIDKKISTIIMENEQRK